MDKLKPLQKQLLAMIGQEIQSHGFQPKPKGQSFLKPCDFGRVSFHLAFIKHRDDFDVTSDVGIRFDKVEEMTGFDDEYRDKTYTLGCELGNLSREGQKRWTIAREDDIPAATESIINAFTSMVLPYIYMFSDIGRALEVLSGDGPDSRLHSPVHAKRAKSAVALALLTQGKEAAQDLAKAKMSFLEQYQDFGLSSFRAFLNEYGLSLEAL